MQNKLYTILFFSLPDDWLVPSLWAAITETWNPKFLQEIWTPWQEWIWTHGNKKSRDSPSPTWPTPIHKLSMMFMVWNISFGHLGCLSGYAMQFFSLPSNQLHRQSLSSDCRTCTFPGTYRFCQTNKFCRTRQTHRKVRTLGKEKIPAPWPTPIYKLSMTSMAWNIFIGQLGLVMLFPSSCTPAR